MSLAPNRRFAALALLSLSGCQLVFGIADYEADGSSTGGGGASAGGSGGEGASQAAGGSPEGGNAPGCICENEPVWRGAKMVASGTSADTPPTVCGDASTPLTLFDGPPEVTCGACSCAASGCELPGLLCFDQAGCPGTGTLIDVGPGDCTAMPSGGCDSYKLAGEVGAATCTVSGGEPSPADLVFDRFASFCYASGCGGGCVDAASTCVVAEDLPASVCPSGFPHRYVLSDGGEPSCDDCTCAGACSGPPYQSGLGLPGCDLVDISETGCTGPGIATYFAHATETSSCTTNHPEAYSGSAQIAGQHTVCCRAAIDGLNEVN